MACHRNGPFLVDTCATTIGAPVFNVDAGEAILLQLCGDIGDASLPLEQIVGPHSDSCTGPVVVDGVPLALSAEMTALLVPFPGTFQLDLSQVPEGVCVKVEATEVKLADATYLQPLFSSPRDCELDARGLQTAW